MDLEARLRAFAAVARRRSFSAAAKELRISQPAVSQHLKVLKIARLVMDRAQGTRRVYAVDPEGIAAIRSWLDQFWSVALDAFKAEAERDDEEPKPST